MKLQDKFGRAITYLRLSVTDRCNLRCTYCMPESGLKFASRTELLSYEEMLRITHVLGDLGVNKIRITGGEPFVRNGLIDFLRELSRQSAIEQIGITSNLTLIQPYLEELKTLEINNVNVSLDSLDKNQFEQITRRNQFDEVYESLMQMIHMGFDLKINCVVMKGTNEDQILPLLELAKKQPISVRFLEEMPFNGSGGSLAQIMDHKQILTFIQEHYNVTRMIDEPSSTSQNYRIDGFVGSLGVIPSFSRTFCSGCNRLRISSTGELRTCLYGSNQLNMKQLIRNELSDKQIQESVIAAVSIKPKDGFAAAEENQKEYLSMTKLGG